jgi:hypothetical protein
MPDKKAAAEGAQPADKKKVVMLSIAGVAFLGAAVLMLFNLGILGGDEPVQPAVPITQGMSEADIKAMEANQRRRDALMRVTTPSGS